LLLAAGSGNTEGKTIIVDADGGGDYKNIQDAINASEDGDTIQVWEGVYEENVVVNKSVSLIGNDSEVTTIDGGGEGSAVEITADWANMGGFKVAGSGDDWWNSGIRVESDHNRIFGNNCSNNYYGIYHDTSNRCTIMNNTCSNNIISGIYLVSSSDCALENNTCNSNNNMGIRFWNSSAGTITNNTCSSNDNYGIWLASDSNDCTITNNICKLNNFGDIRFWDSSAGTITNNTCSSNNGYGIDIESSSDCTIENNSMNENGIRVSGSLKNWNSHTIDITNTVNGKPVYYYKNITGSTVPYGTGQVILANCTWMKVEDQNCSNGSVGILVGHSSNITLTNNTCDSNNWNGIYLYNSSDCTLGNNTCSSNNNSGIYLYLLGSSNTISKNTCNSNNGHGVYLHRSSDSTFENNTCNSNNNGIYVRDSSDCALVNNTCNSNNGSAIYLYFSSDCTLENNTCSSNNGYGIYLHWESSDCALENNTISENRVGIYLDIYSWGNTAHYNNIFNNIEYGISVTEYNDGTVDATHNWWGTASGPCHPTKNSEGEGDNITDYVVFDPWLVRPCDEQRTLYVDDDASDGGDGSWEKPYNKIQDAIDAAEDGDEIRVWEGTYYENVVVNKALNLMGNGSEITTINGNQKGTVVTLKADGITLNGFRITGSSQSWIHAGVHIESNSNRLVDLKCSYNWIGIDIEPSEDNYLAHSIIAWNNHSSVAVSLVEVTRSKFEHNIIHENEGAGVSLWHSSDNRFTNNTFFSNNIAYSLDNSHDNSILNNTCDKNLNDGIYLDHSNRNSISNNTCNSNGEFGIRLLASDKNVMKGNIFSWNQKDGIHVSEGVGNAFEWSTCRENTGSGVYLFRAETVQVCNNTIQSNGKHGVSAEINNGKGHELSYNSIFENTEHGILLFDADENSINHNEIFHNSIGIYLYSSSDETVCKENSAQQNWIYQNWLYGISTKENRGFSINATNNWWGNASGPYHASRNPLGTGDNITGPMEFDPWIGGPFAFIDSIAPNPALDTEEITFMGHGAPSNNIALFVWSSSQDGELYNGTNATFSSDTLSWGTHRISFRIKNDDGVWGPVITEELIIHRRPRAIIISVSSEQVLEGSPVHFVGKGMDDGTVQQFQWMSDKDGVFGSEENVSVSNLSAESHSISLRVKDNYGVWSNWTHWSKQITINRKPRVTIDLLFPNPALDSETVSFVANGTDDDGFIQFYLWNSSIDGKLYNGSENRFSTSELSFGEHTITLMVMDNDYAWSDPVTTNLVATKKPVATIELISPNPTLVGTSVLFQGAGIDDGIISRYAWRADGGVGEFKNSSNPEVSYNNLPLGIRTIFLKVQDNHGVWSDETSESLIVTEKPVAIIEIASSSIVAVGTTLQFNGSGTDDGEIVGYGWDFDDSNGIGEDAVIGNPVHNYSSSGVYTVTFTVIDNHGFTGTAERDIWVVKLLQEFSDPEGDMTTTDLQKKQDGSKDFDISSVRVYQISDSLLFELEVYGKIRTTSDPPSVYVIHLFIDEEDDVMGDDEDFRIYFSVDHGDLKDANDTTVLSHLKYAVEGASLFVLIPLSEIENATNVKISAYAFEYPDYSPESGYGDEAYSLDGEDDDDSENGFLPGFRAVLVVCSFFIAVPVLWWRKRRRRV